MLQDFANKNVHVILSVVKDLAEKGERTPRMLPTMDALVQVQARFFPDASGLLRKPKAVLPWNFEFRCFCFPLRLCVFA